MTDFGLARTFVAHSETTATWTTKLMGTLDYMTPELLSGAMVTPSILRGIGRPFSRSVASR